MSGITDDCLRIDTRRSHSSDPAQFDVEVTRAIRHDATRTMIERTEECLELCPERIVADSAYGSAEMLGWLVEERAIPKERKYIWLHSRSF
jgi:hypothetical protein